VIAKAPRLLARVMRRGGPDPLGPPFDTSGLPLAPGVQVEAIRLVRPRPVLDDPPKVSMRDTRLPEGDLVVGVEIDGEAVAYPTSSLRRHHIVNDSVGGRWLAVTFCGKCFSGTAFDASLDGRRLKFDVFAAYQGSYLMRDRHTGTLWAHLSGEALVGPSVGARLRMVPMWLMEPREWSREHPNSLTPDPSVLARPDVRGPGGSDLGPIAGSVLTWDRRLPERTYVLGIEAGGATVALALGADPPGEIVYSFEMGELPLVILGPGGAWPLAYDRRVGDTVVELRLEDRSVMDASGGDWSFDGRALRGPHAGKRLSFVPSFPVEWFAWAAHHPGTDLRTF
jgi:hypothetical protein